MLRTLSTIRHLRPVQVTDRIRRRLFPLRRLPALQGVYKIRRGPSQLPIVRGDGGFDGHSFLFLNRRWPFEGSSRWKPSGAELLWVYNLHYFQYVHALPVLDGLNLMRDWMDCNVSPLQAGWQPYPIALRVREWLEWIQAHPDIPNDDRDRLLLSIAAQVEALEQQLEFHLMGNHLLEDAISLCWAGLSLEGNLSKGWLDTGSRLLKQEIGRQILEDGTHEERSPMYQALLAEGLLRLAGVASRGDDLRAGEIGELAARAGLALVRSLVNLVHPDSDYALLNDCVLGFAPKAHQLQERCEPPDPLNERENAAWSLPFAGYYGWRGGRGEYMVFDAGPIGPDHQPGHGHADALSFEMSLGDGRLFTDTGVVTYREGMERAYDRSTAAHNTVEIDGRNQSDLWAAFRCGRRIRLLESGSETDGDGALLHGAYRGPGASFRPIMHSRAVKITPGMFAFQDDLSCSGDHQGIVRLHVAPGLFAKKEGNGIAINQGHRRRASVSGDGLAWEISRSPYHPDFGVEEERPCLCARIPFRDEARVLWRIVYAAGGACGSCS